MRARPGLLAASARLLAATLALASSPALQARGESDLVGLINDYRASARDCGGRREPMAGPLAPSAALAAIGAGTTGNLGQALAAGGYRAAVAATLFVTGPSEASGVMRLLGETDCRTLLDPRFTEVGVHRQGDAWQVHLARPLVSPELGDPVVAGRAVLGLVNAARARPRRCGDKAFGAADPLVWNDTLFDAASRHSRDMAARGYFAHVDPDGRSVTRRATSAGYRWTAIGENIAAGQGSSEQVVAGWLSSPGHCANIMAPDFVDFGAAYALGGPLGIYWTQVFGKR